MCHGKVGLTLFVVVFYSIILALVCLSGGSNGSIVISNLGQARILRICTEYYRSITIDTIDSNENGNLWLSTYHDQHICLWKSNTSLDTSEFIDDIVISSTDDTDKHVDSLSPVLARFLDDHLLISIDQVMHVYHLETKQIQRRFVLSHSCHTFDLSTMNRFIAIGTHDRLVQIRDYTNETFQDFLGHSDRISHVRFNQSNQQLITTATNEMFVWKFRFNSI
jgi:hypothetical protein